MSKKMERKPASVIIPTSQIAYLRSTPPSSEALRHSGGDNRLWTSATVTLYFEVLLRRDSRPGTEQNTSPGEVIPEMTRSLLLSFLGLIPKEKHRNPVNGWYMQFVCLLHIWLYNIS